MVQFFWPTLYKSPDETERARSRVSFNWQTPTPHPRLWHQINYELSRRITNTSILLIRLTNQIVNLCLR